MNSSGTTVYRFATYDDSGNPLTQTNFVYKDVTYHHAAFFWDGRQLSAIKVWSDAGETTLVAQLDYLYNDQGYRIRKTITEGNVVDTWSYDLAGSAVLRETFEHKVGNTVTSTSETFYLRDADGTLTGYVRDGTPYYYLKDLQGNIIAVIDEDGTELIEYEYDPYGNILSLTSWDDFPENPYTYRGYRFDSEIGMYYLNSRYYSPVLSRFLNADGMLGQVGDIASVNMYAYCAGNPVMYTDEEGYFPTWLKLALVAVAVAVVSVITGPVMALGYAIGSNIAEVNQTEKFISDNNDIGAMTEDEYQQAIADGKTIGLSEAEKLAYIRYLREYGENAAKLSANWTEGQMLREFNYHDKVYNISSSWLGIPDSESPSSNTMFVDFEPTQSARSYLFRFFGNMIP